MPASPRSLGIWLWAGAALAGLGLLIYLAAPPAPAPPLPALAEDYADPVEDAVMEAEDMLIDVAAQLKVRSWGGALYHVASDFEGSPLLREADGATQVVGGVTLASAGPDPRRLDRRAFGKALETFELREAVFKFPTASLSGDTLTARLKLDAQALRGTRAKRWVAQGDAELVRRDGRWQLRRFQGTDLKTEEGERRFHDVSAALGLPTSPGHDDRESQMIAFGRLFLGGIAAGDIDGDGDADLFVPQIGPDLLLRNDGGRFVECAAERGVADADTGAAALFLDVDNDADLDLWVVNYEPEQIRDRATSELKDNAGHRAVALYRNEGGRFVDVTTKAGLGARGPAMSACAADVDRDGDLDVYVCMYRDDSREDPRFSEEVPNVVWNARDGAPNQLWINRGDGTFREEAVARGVADTGWGLAASFADYDDDGDPDLFVANDYGASRLFRNLGDGRFEDVTATAASQEGGFGMGVTWLDYDADGRLDVYVSKMYSTAGNRILARGPGRMSPEQHARLLTMAKGNTLLRNLGDGRFEDATPTAGAGRAGWAWSSSAFDYDNDGRPDLYVANGLKTSSYTSADL